MAQIDKKGIIRGIAGDMVFRSRGLKTIVQAKPACVNQTRRTIERSLEFGLASTTAKAIRIALKPAYHTYDGGMINRFVNTINGAISACRDKEINHRDLHDGDLTYLSGFQFNANSSVERVLKVRPQLTRNEQGTLTFFLPPVNGRYDVIYPASTDVVQCSLTVSLFAFNLREEYYLRLASQETSIRRGNNEAISWTFRPIVPDGCILIACLSLSYFSEGSLSGRKILNSKDFSPAEIIAAFHYSGEYPDAGALESLKKEDLPGYRGNEKLRNCAERD